MTAAEPSDRRAKPGAVLDQRALLAATTMNAHFLTQKDLRPPRKRVRFGRRE
jgi:hypothetical protein